MFVQYFCRGGFNNLLLAWGGIVVVVAHAAFGAWVKYRINMWYDSFYNLLQTASAPIIGGNETGSGVEGDYSGMDEVWSKLVEFAFLVLPMCIVHPTVKFVRQHWAFAWRLALMKDYVRQWNPSVRPVEGAAQRVHEDTQRFASGLNGCLVVVLDAVCMLLVFIPILLDIGKRVTAPAFGFGVDGFGDAWLVMLAVWSATIGVTGAAIVGRKLVKLEVNNQKVEANLRRELVLLETAPMAVCCASKDDDTESDTQVQMKRPENVFDSLWEDLKTNYYRLFLNFMGLNAWLATFEQYVVLLPYLVAAPLLFAPAPDTIKLGTLVQLSNAFGKVFDALNIVGDNYGSIVDFASCVVRLRQFERSVGRWITPASVSSTHDGGSNGEAVLMPRGQPRSNDPDVHPNSGGLELKSTVELPPGCEPPRSDDEDNRV